MNLSTLHRHRDEDGFTLVELMVTLAIFAILVAIAIPILAQQRQAAEANSIRSDVHAAVNSVKTSLITYPNATGFQIYYGAQPATGFASGIAPVKVNFSDNTDVLTITNPVANLANPVGATGSGAAESGWQVTGTNPNLPGYYYTYNSLTGNFYDSNGKIDTSFQSK